MLDLRYVAGLFDGEGYVRINEWRKPNSTHVRFNIFMGINMTHRPIIEALHRQFGGYFQVSRHDLRMPTHRALYAWIISSDRAAKFLRRILPYCRVKRAEIRVALKLQDHIAKHRYKRGRQLRSNPRREALLAYRRKLAAEISALKRVRFSTTIDRGPMN